MGAATRIAVKDLKLRVRDRSAIILGIIAPLVLAFVFDLVFGGAFTQELNLQYGLVDRDGSEISRGLGDVLDEIEAQGVLTVEAFDSANSAETAVDEGEIDAFILIEEGFGQSVTANADASISVVGSVDAPTSTQIAKSIAQQYATGIEATQLAIASTAAASNATVTPEFFASLTTDPTTAAFSYSLVDVTAATRQLDGTTYFAAGMAVFFLFFTVQFGVLGLLEEEREGTLQRLQAAPIGRTSIVLGKALLAIVLGLISMTVLVVATQLLIGATWGAPLGVALLVIAGVLAAVGIMGLVAAIAKTPEGAGNLGAIIAVILGMLGGVFFQLGSGDDFLSRLTLITPHAWFMDGLANLADGAPWTAALPAVGAIMVFAVVTGVVSWILLRRRFVR
ncbi:MAG TPA: ABC transporter permease [Acidimicrobiia bacterium]|nr:ABC transporter permease [Acidimicrobiia bacterium]